MSAYDKANAMYTTISSLLGREEGGDGSLAVDEVTIVGSDVVEVVPGISDVMGGDGTH